jgi:hypothetical protein
MEVQLFDGDISNAQAEGLVCPVDGAICILGGPAAAKALKNSFDPEDRDELFGYLEKDVLNLRPIPDGGARIIQGEGDWDWLVVVAAVPHHVNDQIIGKNAFSHILQRSIINGIRESVNHEIGSIAMTVIGSSYRLAPEICIRSMAEAFAVCRKVKINIVWCFLDSELREMAREHLEKYQLAII